MATNASFSSTLVLASFYACPGDSRVSASLFASTLNYVASYRHGEDSPPSSETFIGDNNTKATFFATPEIVADPAWQHVNPWWKDILRMGPTPSSPA
uniref:Uncharacterized protein n=1 Tax=Cannabis sativa TaxID=3483 RepID=A0A803NVG3_CANSA